MGAHEASYGATCRLTILDKVELRKARCGATSIEMNVRSKNGSDAQIADKCISKTIL